MRRMKIGRWMAANGEGIYDTGPWSVFGEGPVMMEAAPISGQGVNEGGRDLSETLESGKVPQIIEIEQPVFVAIVAVLLFQSTSAFRNTVQFRGGPAAVIGDGCRRTMACLGQSLSGSIPAGRRGNSGRSESQKTC